MNQITAGLCVYTDHVLLMCKISMVSWRALPFIRRQVIMLSGIPHPKALGGGAGDWYRAAKACYYRMAFQSLHQRCVLYVQASTSSSSIIIMLCYYYIKLGLDIGDQGFVGRRGRHCSMSACQYKPDTTLFMLIDHNI